MIEIESLAGSIAYDAFKVALLESLIFL